VVHFEQENLLVFLYILYYFGGKIFHISSSVLRNIKNGFLTQNLPHNSCYFSNDTVFSKIFYIFCHNLSFGLATKAKGLQGCGSRGRKPESQGKGIAMLRAKRKSGSHITYSRECKKVWGRDQGKGVARLRAKRKEARESKQRHCKVAGQEEARESYHILPRV
jgi:hypothetical protein